MQSHDESRLMDMLSTISEGARAVFAAACAERLMPYYLHYSEMFRKGDPEALRRGLNLVWDHVLDPQWSVRELEPFAARAMDLAPGDEDEWTALNPLAENAAAAVYYCLQCRMKGDAKSAVLSARQAYEAVDYLTQNIRHIQFGSPESERKILSDTLVQDELSRQVRDLHLLAKGALDVPSLQALKTRAEREGTTLLNETLGAYLASVA